MPKQIDLTGQRFGKLTVIKKEHRTSNRNKYWLCKCDCENEIIVRQDSLTSGHTKSCGCYKSDVISRQTKTHGMSNRRLYNSWAAMKARCNNPNCKAYRDYGQRGIKVCDKWNDKHGFEDFMKWALSHGYDDNLTIERIDNNGNYEPDNCRWATKTEQSNNRRGNRKYEYQGELHTISEWARIKGMNRNTLSNRLLRSGMDIEQALKQPIQRRRKCG